MLNYLSTMIIYGSTISYFIISNCDVFWQCKESKNDFSGTFGKGMFFANLAKGNNFSRNSLSLATGYSSAVGISCCGNST
jgi:hypothetical protein